jgi:hypothetical protein
VTGRSLGGQFLGEANGDIDLSRSRCEDQRALEKEQVIRVRRQGRAVESRGAWDVLGAVSGSRGQISTRQGVQVDALERRNCGGESRSMGGQQECAGERYGCESPARESGHHTSTP